MSDFGGTHGRVPDCKEDFSMLNFDEALNNFLDAIFGFINEFLNGLFGWLTAFFSNLNINIS